METYIVRRRPSFSGPILAIDALTEFPLQSVTNWTIAMCVRSLTERFEEKPFYICVSASRAVNAVMADLGDFHCMILGERLCSLVVQLIGGLGTSAHLQRYLATGAAPPEPDGPSTCSRDEALDHVLRLTLDFDEPFGAAVTPLTMLAMYFLAAHEVGHVALGHLESRLVADGLISEGQGEAGEVLAQSRALEWDADSFAAAATVWFTGASPQIPELALFFPTMASGLRHFVVAAYAFFSAMDLLETSEKGPSERTHPPPLVRVTLAMTILAQSCQRWGRMGADEVHEIATAAIRATEIALYELGGATMSPAVAQSLQTLAGATLEELGPLLMSLHPTLNRHRLENYFWAAGF